MDIGYERIELHLSTNPDLVKGYGKAIKAAGGEYRSARGYTTSRVVILPMSVPERLLNDLVDLYHIGKSTAIMLRDATSAHIEKTGDKTDCIHVPYIGALSAVDMITKRYKAVVALAIKENKPINLKVYQVCSQHILEFTAVRKNGENSYMVTSRHGRVVVGPFGTIDAHMEAGSHSGYLNIHNCYESLSDAKAAMKVQIDKQIEVMKSELKVLQEVKGQC